MMKIAFSCEKYLKDECDGCGACRAEPEYECRACGGPIYEGDTYYDYGDGPYCDGCNELARETA